MITINTARQVTFPKRGGGSGFTRGWVGKEFLIKGKGVGRGGSPEWTETGAARMF